MAIYCWGSTTNGELGLGGIEDEQILTPRQMTWAGAADLKQAACGSKHTLLLTDDGKVYSCGNNDFGQLGHTLPRKRPQLIPALENHKISQVSCGSSHSMCINEWGQIFSWGSNSHGQLGIQNGEKMQPTPKIVRGLVTKQTIQISCGDYHSLALTNSGELYTWGANDYGQLGLGTDTQQIGDPTLIESLSGIPFAFVTCGSNHSFAVSKSGAIFGWGKNTFGQLGINDETSKSFPCQLKTLRSRGVRYIACGEDFSVFLTLDGGVFTCGSGNYGQLGHGGCNNEILPRMIMELMGSTITQVTCGRSHTLALVPSRGRVYGFGLGGSGQLGIRASRNSSVPQVVMGPWVSPSGSTLLENSIKPNLDDNMTIKRIYSGGDHCFVSVVEQSKGIPPEDCRFYKHSSQILSLSIDFLTTLVTIDKNSTVDLDILTVVETTFKSLSCFNSSFLQQNDGHSCCTSKHHGVEMATAEDAFDMIRKIENDSIKHLIWESITVDLLMTLIPSPADVETLRIYLILPLYHEFINPKKFPQLHVPFCKALLQLQPIPMKIIRQWWGTESNQYFERLVELFKSVAEYIINFILLKNQTKDQKQLINYDINLILVLNVLELLYKINHQDRVNKIRYEVFHMPELNETIDLQQDYLRWNFEKSPNKLYLCSYPFLFDAEAKTLLLQTDQGIQMHQAMQTAAAQNFMMLFSGIQVDISHFVVLNVSREKIVEDTLREILKYGTSDLKKPLKIKFHDEEAEDAGGVRKEFFMLLLRDIFDPKYGMFTTFEDSRACWFAEHSFESEVMYMLIGVICGLAIYNFTIINLPFPVALYKKLLKEDSIDINDLRDLSPIMANSMQSILDYNEPDFAETFNLTFEISREIYGEIISIRLKPNGDKIPVTLENKREFVDLYIDFIFNKSVEKHFNGFYNGFMKVCDGIVFQLFNAQELMAVVIGNEDYDWHALETGAEYKHGYNSGDETIQLFWKVFHELPEIEKKKFLLFLTGSDRIPIQGMKAIKIIIQPTLDDKFLPVAHTCFNLLDLPRYKTKEKLRYKLQQAIQQTQGFSLV